jgi:hypothetical protein
LHIVTMLAYKMDFKCNGVVLCNNFERPVAS